MANHSNHILVTGGAGYIGSHICKCLSAHGYRPVTYDNLVSGNAHAVKWGPFEHGDILDAVRLNAVFRRYPFKAVIHVAGYTSVEGSTKNPDIYFQNNTEGSRTVVSAMLQAGVKHIVFSSSAAVYEAAQAAPLTENSATGPASPYGQTKHETETLLQEHSSLGNLNIAILRYFNAAGADPKQETGCEQPHPTNLIPRIMQVLSGTRRHLDIYGTDYDTPDGTAVRDYLHATDLAMGHIAALEYIQSRNAKLLVNLGSGKGHSVKTVVDMTEQLTGRTIPTVHLPRRQGDAPVLCADISKAKALLGWQPTHSTIATILHTAWQYERSITQKNAGLRNQAA